MFIDHRQEQWPEWLGIVEFAYNNKIHSVTKVSPFRANCGQDLRMGFKERRRGRHKAVEEFVERIKRIQEEVKVVLKKVQEEMKWYIDRKRRKGEEYWKGDLVILSTKDLKLQIKGRRTEKLTEWFVGLYKVKRVVSTNTIELELPITIKTHPVVNVSRVQLYKPQVEDQGVVPLQLVVIDEKEAYEVEKILNRRKVQGRNKFLVWWKGYIVETDTWEGQENLENAKELIEEFERKYGEETKEIKWQELKEEEEKFSWELPREFTAKYHNTAKMANGYIRENDSKEMHKTL